MWIGDTVYFRSDRAGEFNLFAFDTKGKQVQQLTTHADFPVLSASAGAGRIVYEQAGSLHLLDPRAGTSEEADDRRGGGPAGDAAAVRQGRQVDPRRGAVADRRARGVRVPRRDRHRAGREGRRAQPDQQHRRCTTDSRRGRPDGDRWPGSPTPSASTSCTSAVRTARESRAPSWSRARASTATGVVAGLQEDRLLRQLAVGLLARRQERRVEEDRGAAALRAGRSSSAIRGRRTRSGWRTRWTTAPTITTVYAYSIEQDKSFQISDGLSDVSDPVFDKSGKYLFFFASTDAGPVKDWFAQSNADMRATSGIYLAVLPNDLVSPLARESDEEKPGSAEKKDDAKPEAKKDEPKGPIPEEKPAAGKDQPFRIDFEGLRVPHPRSADQPRRHLQPADRHGGTDLLPEDRGRKVGAEPLRPDHAEERDRSCPTSATTSSRRTGRSCCIASGSTWSIVPTTRKIEPSEGRLNIDGIEVRVDPRGEWKQIFDEAWRINRDYFYAPNMHGVDWERQHEKYAAFLPHVATRARSQPRDPVDVQRAGGRASQRRRRRCARRAENGSRRPARRRLRDRERPLPVQEGLRRPELESAAARPAHRAGRQCEGRRVPARGQRQGPASADQRLQPVREHLGQDRRDHARPERRRQRLADGAGRADRQRSGVAQPRLGRGQPAEGRQGDRRPRRLRLRAEHRRVRAFVLQALLLSAGRQGRGHRRRALQRRRAASPTTTSTSCAGRSSPTGRCATATI